MKLFATLPALALVVALSASAVADNGVVSNATLSDMGLAGIQVMSDDAALAIRGMGYQPKHKKKSAGHDKPWSLAFGVSYASIDKKGADSGTVDGFAAEGQYMAMGEHFSEAGISETTVKTLEVKGAHATTETTINSLRVFSGGFASASSL